MTDILVRVAEVLTTNVRVSAGVGGPVGPMGPVLVAMSLRGEQVVGVGTQPLPFTDDFTIVEFIAAATTPPLGSSLVLDVLKNGTSIFPTATKPTILAGQTVSGIAVPDDTAILAGDVFTVDVLQIGSLQAGANVTLVMKMAVA